MYVIVTDALFDDEMELWYLGWQPDYYWGHGYFWTLKETFVRQLTYNTAGHRFAFRNIEDAWRLVRNLNLTTGRVIKLDLDH